MIPKCAFCNKAIHFYEELVAEGGLYFHVQIISDTSIRCKKTRPIALLLNLEAEVLARKT